MPDRPTIADTFLNATKETKRQRGEDQPSAREVKTGIGPTIEAVPQYNISPSETLIEGKHNAVIIIGRDKPNAKGTGWDMHRKSGVGCIDIIAGLSGPLAKEANEQGEGVMTEKNTYLDSARIYISQQAKDIDSEEYFNIVAGGVGKVLNESAIAIKADSVRVIGRQGIKIVTGTDKYSGGSGFFIGDTVPGIDLIAGNDDTELQPLVKGDDLAKTLDRHLELMQELHGFANFSLDLTLTKMAAESPIPAVSVPAITKLTGMMAKAIPIVYDLKTWQLNAIMHKLNYSADNPFAAYDFRSKYNTTN